MPAHDELLTRFQPVLRYDSNEQFFADGGEQYAVNPGNELRRKRTETGNGAVLAAAQPTGDTPQLTLGFLGREKYADGTPVEEGDIIGVTGKSYREQYRRLRIAHPELSNVMYGHAVEANDRLWLQYWLFYFYNDYQLSFGVGTHEGDWEVVQYRYDAEADAPDVAVYAQHRFGELREWDKVEKHASDPDRPVVYVARGSHAAYFEAGFHQTEGWYDLADGKREAPRLRLEIVSDDTHPWLLWPGRWGDTLPRKKGIETDSPTGPGKKNHWRQPDKLLDNKPSIQVHGKKGAAPPEVLIKRDGGRLRCEYDVTKRDPRPHVLVITVNSKDEEGVPPRTHTIEVHVSGHGKVTTELVLDPLKHYDVNTSMVAGEPPKPSESALSLVTPFQESVLELDFGRRVLRFLSQTFGWLRGDRRRATRPKF